MHEELITREGYERLKAELERLEHEERVRIAAQIAQARAYGDLSENHEYKAAKEAQGELEARIAQLRRRLRTARIVEPDEGDGAVVGLGHRVRLQDLTRDRELEYQLVGQGEADASQGKISVQSPVGRALFGRKVGERVTVQAPAGPVCLKILEIRR